ncbi:hypothetical protein O4H66_17250 [Comamonadaceae bacterium G21597-S1]|nr:hypothetical protein [Comamonadaceae bacterium G21597-S1]
MLVLRPQGRGNWAPTRIVIDGARIGPMTFRAGQLLPLGGIVFRIVMVLP